MSAAPAPIPVVHFAPRYGRAARLVDVEPIEPERDGQRIVALPLPGRLPPTLFARWGLAVPALLSLLALGLALWGARMSRKCDQGDTSTRVS